MFTLTKDSFKFTEAGTYQMEGDSRTIEFIEKVSNVGTGKQTFYRCLIDGVEHFATIGYFKKMFDATVFHREGTSEGSMSVNKILTDDEITAKVDNMASKFNNINERIASLIKSIDENDEPISVDFSAYVEKFRNNLIARNEDNKKKAEDNKKKAEERKMAAKVRESVATMSDLQKELMAAILANDFAKVAELSAKMQR